MIWRTGEALSVQNRVIRRQCVVPGVNFDISLETYISLYRINQEYIKPIYV